MRPGYGKVYKMLRAAELDIDKIGVVAVLSPSMPTLPWLKLVEGPTDRDATVMASRFVLRFRRHVPAFLRAALQIRRQVVSLVAEPLKASFWTLSAWRDRSALDDFVHPSPHIETMKRFHEHMSDARFKFWTVPSGALPVGWADAKARLAAEHEVPGLS